MRLSPLKFFSPLASRLDSEIKQEILRLSSPELATSDHPLSDWPPRKPQKLWRLGMDREGRVPGNFSRHAQLSLLLLCVTKAPTRHFEGALNLEQTH